MKYWIFILKFKPTQKIEVSHCLFRTHTKSNKLNKNVFWCLKYMIRFEYYINLFIGTRTHTKKAKTSHFCRQTKLYNQNPIQVFGIATSVMKHRYQEHGSLKPTQNIEVCRCLFRTHIKSNKNAFWCVKCMIRKHVNLNIPLTCSLEQELLPKNTTLL
jgi:hypothetical protein